MAVSLETECFLFERGRYPGSSIECVERKLKGDEMGKISELRNEESNRAVEDGLWSQIVLGLTLSSTTSSLGNLF